MLEAGAKFGKLTIVELFDRRDSRDRYICHCECGRDTIVEGRNLRRGVTRSCGCLRANNNKGRVYRGTKWQRLLGDDHADNSDSKD
jgi:hypothetical protein